MAESSQAFEHLMQTIIERRDRPPTRSYTTTLLQGGVEAIGRKITEEAREVVEAAGEPTSDAQRAHVVHEAADVMYHLFVLLAHQRIELQEVASELARRAGVSGLDEKAARQAPKAS